MLYSVERLDCSNERIDQVAASSHQHAAETALQIWDQAVAQAPRFGHQASLKVKVVQLPGGPVYCFNVSVVTQRQYCAALTP